MEERETVIAFLAALGATVIVFAFVNVICDWLELIELEEQRRQAELKATCLAKFDAWLEELRKAAT